MTLDQVANRVRFTWYIPKDPSSVKRGVFVSGPFEDRDGEFVAYHGKFTSEADEDDHGDLVVKYLLDGSDEEHTIDLCSLGITRSRDGAWRPCLTVEREE